jgi:hypothetical protein
MSKTATCDLATASSPAFRHATVCSGEVRTEAEQSAGRGSMSSTGTSDDLFVLSRISASAIVVSLSFGWEESV